MHACSGAYLARSPRQMRQREMVGRASIGEAFGVGGVAPAPIAGCSGNETGQPPCPYTACTSSARLR